jgi:glycosyltransferase involved in cell wall biosynthesis
MNAQRRSGQGRVGVYHPGTQHSWQTALAFQESGALAWFATSILYDPARLPYSAVRFLPGRLRSRVEEEFRRRDFPQLDKRLVRQFGWREWLAVPLRRARMTRAARAVSQASARAGARAVAALIGNADIDTLWTFDAVGLEAMQVARQAGIRSVLDQTIGHLASLAATLRIEAEKHPAFFASTAAAVPAEAIARQVAELAVADHVVVGSDFAAATLIDNGVAPGKITIVRYGFDEALFRAPALRRAPRGRPVKFLMVGAINPRKGPQYLFEAFRRISPTAAELHIVGPLEIDPGLIPRDLPHLHIHPSVARRDIPQVMAAADCLILPSLFEGCSLSLHEGLAAGLPIIHSRSAGDGIVDGNGTVLAEVSTAAVLEAVNEVIEAPQLIEQWSARSCDLAAKHSAAGYRRRVAEFHSLLDRR